MSQLGRKGKGSFMFNRILLPLDGSALAECVLPHALALAKPANSEVVLLHIIEEKSIEMGVDPLDWNLRKVAAQAYLDTICAGVQAAGVSTDCRLLAGEPAGRIVEQVEALGADLVIVSSHGQSGQTDWTLGAVARKVIEGIGTSVMLVRSHPMPETSPALVPAQYRTLMVSLDGSRRAECVLPIAERFRDDQHADLVLVHIVQRPYLLGWAMLPENERQVAEQMIEHAQEVAQNYLSELQTRQGERTSLVLSLADNVATELSEIAERHQVDLLLLSAHGAAANPNRAFGDTVNAILSHCRQPVLIYQDQPVQRTGENESAPSRGRQSDPETPSSLVA